MRHLLCCLPPEIRLDSAMEGLSAIPVNFRKFGLKHDFPEMFYTPQYRVPMPVYVGYKMAAFAYTLVVLVLQFGRKWSKSPWIFFSNWSYILQSASLALAVVVCFWKALNSRCRRPDQVEIPQTFDHMSWYLKLRWVLHNIASTSPYLVTVTYWTFLWPNDQEKQIIPGFLLRTIQIHGMNSVLALLDQLMDRTPILLRHFCHPLLLFSIYAIFSLIYFSRVAKPIYPFLDWNSPGWTALVCCLWVVAIVSFHIIALAIKRLQLKYSCGLTVTLTEDFIEEETPMLPHHSVTS